ncbi:uncharacterized protein LOC143062410 [Mytilus galloprovincialis]|uniref:uncharacterized protein LOC143062410 n=1 Tax=Mytilus galloprovincialis TaxID=29158 RepID=UPI003F7B782F
MAFAINSQIPGPSLIVYEGQQIVIRVKNDLWMEGITFHWHGLPQKGTPYMDGVPRVTQCPINPGETFTYRFTAQPSGTFWYHSHLGTQRSDGLAGALIILENPSLQHILKVVAVDGTEVEAEQAESVILHSAERIDVEIQSNAHVGNYWIRMEDMAAKDTNEKPINMVKGYGILRYSAATSDEPISLRTECTTDRPCRVINCLFGKFPDKLNTYCVPMSSLKSLKSEIKKNPVPMPVSKNDFQEFFMNFHFTKPTGFGRAHPVHMHGHRFHVMKIGFPDYNTTTGNLTRMNPDIKCNTLECNRAEWADELWNYGNVPGMNVDNPPIKDTIIVPWGGYVVIRIVADNPGYWYFHCHIELHNVDGMALVLQEGNKTQMPALPVNFRTCGDFVLKDNENIALFSDGLLTDSTDSTDTGTRYTGVQPKTDDDGKKVSGQGIISPNSLLQCL